MLNKCICPRGPTPEFQTYKKIKIHGGERTNIEVEQPR